MNSGDQGRPRPVCQEWTVSTPPSAGRVSWPPATGRSTDPLASVGRCKSDTPPGLAFSNMTALLHPSSPTTPWTPEVQRPTSEPRLSEESEAPARGSWRRTAPQEGSNGLRRSEVGPARQPEKSGHILLEKASSWPHRRDPRRPVEDSSEVTAVPGEGSSKHKDWHRQGLRRPSILPESPVGECGAGTTVTSPQSRLCPALPSSSIFCPPGSYWSPCWLPSPMYPAPGRGKSSKTSLSSWQGSFFSPSVSLALLWCVFLWCISVYQHCSGTFPSPTPHHHRHP